jgi:hypothetical protein
MKSFVSHVSLSPTHTFSKFNAMSIKLLKGFGVEGDAHCGRLMKHRSRLKLSPVPPNLRQVHLIHSELFDELRINGFQVDPGEIGENITTKGIDLLSLPRNTKLYIGEDAVVEITGLRNPCNQLNNLQNGLLSEVLGTGAEGNIIRKAGIMGIVEHGGEIRPGDEIGIEFPKKPYIKLERV